MIVIRLKEVFIQFAMLALIITPQISLAALDGLKETADATGHTTINSKIGGDLKGIIANVIKVVLGLMGVLFLILMVYGGFLWMTAEGNDQRVEEAQKIIKNAVFGIAVVLMAYLITYFVISRIVGETLQS